MLAKSFRAILACVLFHSGAPQLPALADDAVTKPAERPAGNHLVGQTSPYLFQHSTNPVDWYPWGEAALARAKKENKPIFLSIGYSSCHWCHVMERESFMDEEIARLLNDNFVCIKVDREERPDVDNIYMTALQVYNQLNGAGKGGGWPLSMFLTPQAEPFFGGTYFPARDGDREGIPGFLAVLTKVSEVWKESPDRLRDDAKNLTRFTKRELEGRRLLPLKKIDDQLLSAVQEALAEQFDAKAGGFGFSEPNAALPKFPEASNLVFLLDRARRTDDEAASRMLILTLERMGQGGIRDHVGGGFHRYSTDRHWRIPHFEKMLYDQGQLLSVYSQSYELSHRREFEVVARETADFVLRELTDPQGGFYAALDAESEGEEGRFYTWSREELQKALSKAEYEQFAVAFGINSAPNFGGQRYVPLLPDEQRHPEAWVAIRSKLLAARDRRPRPKTDTKIITADNGLMITGLADAGRILKEPRYLAAAETAANFLLQNLRTQDFRLLRTYGGGKASLNAYATDYAYLVEGLLAIHRANGDQRWLKSADELMQKQIELFHDEDVGDFFFNSDDHETLLARIKDSVDNAQPAANSVSVGNLIYLAVELKRPDYLELASSALHASAGMMEVSPYAAPRMAVNVARLQEARKTLTGAMP